MNQDSYLKNIIDAIPSAIYIVNKNLSIFFVNQAALKIYNTESKIILRKLCGEIFHCLHAKESEKGCGTTKYCPECVIRNSVDKAIHGKTVFKQKYKMKIQREEKIETAYMLISSAPFEHDGQTYALLTIDDITELTELTELKNLLPICAKCKKIRMEKEFWVNIENYFNKHTDIRFTHSICPDCSKVLYSELNSDNKEEN